MDARPRHRMGLLQASAADGMGGSRLDVGVSAHQLVVSNAGAGQFGLGPMDCRSDHAPLRSRRQETGCAAAVDADADLPVSRPAVQRQRGSAADLADRDLLLPAVVRNASDTMGRCRRRQRSARDAGQILLGISDRQFLLRGGLASATTRLFHIVDALGFHGRGIHCTAAASELAAGERRAAIRLCDRPAHREDFRLRADRSGSLHPRRRHDPCDTGGDLGPDRRIFWP